MKTFCFVLSFKQFYVKSHTGTRDTDNIFVRQYHEFYSLQSALVQYHGIFEDTKVNNVFKNI